MGFGIAGAFKVPGAVMVAHVGGHIGDDRIETGAFFRGGFFFCQRQAVVRAAQIDKRLNNARQRLLKNRVQGGAKKRVEAALDLEH